MITSFYLAVIQLFDKSLQKTLWVALSGSTCLFLLLWLITGYIFSQNEFLPTGWFFGLFDWVYEKLIGFLGGLLIFTLTWFLFPSVLSLIITFLLEDIISAVENKHYPDLSVARKQNIAELFRITLKFTLTSIILNILVIPLYIVFFFLGPINLFIFYTLNGYILGREYFELIAFRRIELADGKQLYKKLRQKIFWAGIINAFLMTIPLVNMLAPIISAATMVHLIQRYSYKKT